MLAPDARTVAVDLLRPPPEHTLDRVVLTTYSLDLETLLALPFAVLTHSDGGLEEMLADPLTLLTALRQSGEKVQVFVDEGAIAIPAGARPLYAMLEASVHPVRAPHGGAFHPKVWVARFLDPAGAPVLRVAVLSRNLTFDRCWDIALATDGAPRGKQRSAASRGLGELLRSLPRVSTQGVSEQLTADLLALADEAERTNFASPAGFDGAVHFHPLGLGPRRRKPWQPRDDGGRLLAIAPFANKTALDVLTAITAADRTLVSRQETLDDLPNGALDAWQSVLVLADAAAEEPEDGTGPRPSGLHAKAIAIEHGWDVTWFVGSANLTAAAFTGTNVEMMVSLTGKKSRREAGGIDRFMEDGFMAICKPYVPSKPLLDELAKAAHASLEVTRKALAAAPLRVVCAAGSQDSWTWTVVGDFVPPPGIEVETWPITLGEDQARQLVSPSIWIVPLPRLTAFVAFKLSCTVAGGDDVRITLKLPTEGMPDGRVAHVLRSLIDSPERFLRFLRALLGGLEGLTELPAGDGSGTGGSWWVEGLGGETLLEDLVRAASRDPSRLTPIRNLIADLRATEEGRLIVPDALYEIWTVVDQALTTQEAA